MDGDLSRTPSSSGVLGRDARIYTFAASADSRSCGRVGRIPSSLTSEVDMVE